MAARRQARGGERVLQAARSYLEAGDVRCQVDDGRVDAGGRQGRLQARAEVAAISSAVRLGEVVDRLEVLRPHVDRLPRHPGAPHIELCAPAEEQREALCRRVESGEPTHHPV